MPKINTDITSSLTSDEKEVFSLIREVINKYTPSTNAFAVGGWTRDKLLGIPSDDIDIMLDTISGEDFAKLLTQQMGIKDPHIIRENPEKSKHLSVAKTYIPLSSGTQQEIDFAQARTEVYRGDSRVPEIQEATPQEDAYRRDLTINSIFYNINNNKLVDFTGSGIKDLIGNVIRTPQDPLKTFSEDPLRIFRTIRFAAKYNGQIDPETYKAMMDPSLRNEIKQKISKERIGVEFVKMLKNPNPQRAIELMKETGLWQDIMAEALMGTKYEGKIAPLEMDQNNPHHVLTVWEHTMQVVKNLIENQPEMEEEKRVVMIMAALMHDLGKLYYEIHTPSKSHEGRTSYIGHEQESREMAEHILRYLKLEGNLIKQVSGLAENHMRPHRFTEQGVDSLRAMRRFIRLMGESSLNWIDVFNLAVADAYSKGLEIDPNTIQTYQGLENNLQEALVSLKPIKENTIEPILNGNEIMQILNIKPGPWMTEIVEFVKELRDENPDITKDEASMKLKEKYGHLSPAEIKEAQEKKEEKKKSSTCPRHLLKSKIDEINKDLKEDNCYTILPLLQELQKEYGNDDNVTRLIAITTFKLLLRDQKLRHNELLIYIFKKSEENFFDIILCSYVIGILLLIETATEDDIIKEIAERMITMSPGIVRKILDSLPENVYRPKLKEEFKKQLK